MQVTIKTVCEESYKRFYGNGLGILFDVIFLVYKMALEQDFLPVFQFSPVCIIPPMLHTHSNGCN
jgi:hypothetical protein